MIAHEPSGRFDLDRAQARGAAWPGLVGMDLVPMVTTPAQRFTWDETPWHGREATAERRAPEFHVVAIDYGIKRNILRALAGDRLRT